KAYPANPKLFRLKLTCRTDTHEAEMQLTWSPEPAAGQAISAAADSRAPLTFALRGREKMGNGAKKADGTDSTSGPAAAVLYTTNPNSGAPNLSMPLPAETLAIRNIFPDETVVFPFDRLTAGMRQALSTCFSGNTSSR